MPADLLAALDGCRSLDKILSLDEYGTGTVLHADIQENPLEPSFAFLRLMQHAEESAEKIEAQRARFKTAYGIIEQADLEAEYEAWVEENNK